MAFQVYLRWLSFALYVGFFCVFPLGVLGNIAGVSLGIFLTCLVLFAMGWNGSQRILARLRARPFLKAEAPEIYGMVQEYARRLEIPCPRLALIETDAIHFACFGFSRDNSFLVLTRGALSTFSREQLSACLSREMTLLWHREVFCLTWLSQFLSFVDYFTVSPTNVRTDSFKIFLKQIILYPLALFPVLILGKSVSAEKLDFLSAKLSRKPRALAESMRLMEANSERIPFPVPFSVRHLFLLTPATKEPVVRILFQGDSMLKRIRSLEQLSHSTALL